MWEIWIEKYSLKLQAYWKTFDNINKAREESLSRMGRNNPRIVLRNYLAEIAIKAASKDNFSVSQRLLEKLQTPFSNDEPFQKIEIILPVRFP